jgi:hypothetical protein
MFDTTTLTATTSATVIYLNNVMVAINNISTKTTALMTAISGLANSPKGVPPINVAELLALFPPFPGFPSAASIDLFNIAPTLCDIEIPSLSLVELMMLAVKLIVVAAINSVVNAVKQAVQYFIVIRDYVKAVWDWFGQVCTSIKGAIAKKIAEWKNNREQAKKNKNKKEESKWTVAYNWIIGKFKPIIKAFNDLMTAVGDLLRLLTQAGSVFSNLTRNLANAVVQWMKDYVCGVKVYSKVVE